MRDPGIYENERIVGSNCPSVAEHSQRLVLPPRMNQTQTEIAVDTHIQRIKRERMTQSFESGFSVAHIDGENAVVGQYQRIAGFERDRTLELLICTCKVMC